MSDLISRKTLLEEIGNAWEYANPITIIDLILKAPAITQSEPVAIVDEVATSWDGKHIFNAVGKVNVGDKLYAAPQQQQWVGLSDDDFKDTSWFSDEFIEGANWAQNKLKELNHDTTK